MLLLPGEATIAERRLRVARWGVALSLAAGLACGAVELWEAAVALLIAAAVLAWAR
jgi:hypothetical protein